MRIENKKGSAVTELILIFPLLLMLITALWNFFILTTAKRNHLIAQEYGAKKELRQKSLRLAIKDRPCLVHPKICAGRSP